MTGTTDTRAPTVNYAHFFRRFNAYGIDATLVFAVAYLLDLLVGSAFAQVPEDLRALVDTMNQLQAGNITPDMQQQAGDALLRSMLGGSVIGGPSEYLMGTISAFYNILFVAGAWQATPGKHWLGLKVTMEGGRRLTLLESAIRHSVSGISMLPLGAGYVTIFFTRKRLALHDLLCNTRVIRVKE